MYRGGSEPDRAEVLPVLPAQAGGKEGRLTSLARGVVRGSAFAAWTAALLPFGIACRLAGRETPPGLKRLFFRGTCRIVGIRVRTVGKAVRSGGVLFVSNHVSYVDIPALGTAVDVRFVAKAEVSRWPVFGLLAKLAGTLFIERDPRQAAEQRDLITDSLSGGDRLFLFPEGTSSDGRAVLPFKSSLFAGLARPGLLIQPVTIAYRGDPDAAFAWYGDMTLLPHLGSILCLRGVDLELVFHPPVDPTAFASRKELARHLESQVATGLGNG